MSIDFVYFVTVKSDDVPVPSSVDMRTVCVPIGVLWINVSPDFVVPSTLSSRNQKIFTDGFCDTAINDMGAKSSSDTITVFVSAAGDTMYGVVVVSWILSKSHPGINGGGVLRVMPARRNMSRNSASQNS